MHIVLVGHGVRHKFILFSFSYVKFVRKKKYKLKTMKFIIVVLSTSSPLR